MCLCRLVPKCRLRVPKWHLIRWHDHKEGYDVQFVFVVFSFNISIAVTSHKSHGIPNRHQLDCLLNSVLRSIRNIEVLCFCPFVRESPYKGPVMRKVFPRLHIRRCRTCVAPRSAWPLTHLILDKMVAIFRTTFSNAFSWMKIFEFRVRFHWSLFLGVQLTIFQHWFR